MKYSLLAILIITSVLKLYSQNSPPGQTDRYPEDIETEEMSRYLQKYLVPFLKQHGFTLSSVDEFGFEISKKVGNIQYLSRCNKLNRSTGIYFQSPDMWVRFDEVENLIDQLRLKYVIDDGNYTLRNYDNDKTAVAYRQWIAHITITNESDFAGFCKEVSQFYSKVVFSFFDTYNSIASLHTFIKKTSEEDVPYHVLGEFQLKKMITLRLCNDLGYPDYAEYVRLKFESIKNLENGKYVPLLNAYYELAGMLKKDQMK